MQEINKPIRMKPECIRCLLKSRLNVPEGTPVEKEIEFMQRVLRAIADLPMHHSAPVVVKSIDLIRKEMFGYTENFKEVKRYFNDLMMSKVPVLQEHLEKSNDPIRLGIQYAITGNYIDFGAMDHVNEEHLQKFIDDASDIAFDERELSSLKEDISHAKKIVYITDNCGEVVMDKMLVHEIHKQNPNAAITILVRGSDVLNDATLEDAKQVGLSDVAYVMGNGSNIAGTCLEEISEEARILLESADVILAKGQGNFETLQECGLNVYYIFMCKCMMFANRFQVPQYTGMLINDKSCVRM